MPVQYNEQLRRYINYYIKKGTPVEKIRKTLIESGWGEQAVNAALK